MNLARAFEESVQRHPEKIALFWGEREFSYAELWKQSRFVSTELGGRFGVKPGDRVGLWLKNCPEFVPALFGILHAGAVVVPINNFLKPDEVNYILADAGIDVLITDAELGAHFPALAAARPALKMLQVETFLAQTATCNLQPATPASPASTLQRFNAFNEPLQAWPSSSTPPARPAGRKARCCRTATCCTTSRAAGSCCKPSKRTGWRCCCRCFTVTC